MMFSALFSVLITCVLLFLDISTIALMFPFNWGKVVSIFRYALICHKLVLSAQRSVLLYTLFLTFFLTLSHTLIFFVSPPMAEHIFIPRHWITIHNRIDTDIAHGIVCRGIYVGSTIYQRYTLHFGGKFKNIIFNLINSICADVTMITYFFFSFLILSLLHIPHHVTQKYCSPSMINVDADDWLRLCIGSFNAVAHRILCAFEISPGARRRNRLVPRAWP